MITRSSNLDSKLKLPIAIVIGVMKGGTTALHNYLSAHSEVCAAEGKELRFFNGENSNKTLDWYLDNFDWTPSRHKIRLESSPAYTSNPKKEVPEIIYKYFPHARIIYLLRDPISRIESQIIMETIKGRQTRKDFARELVSCCLYYTSLKNYLAVFPPEQILLVRSEDLLEQREETLRGICRFLGIKEDISSMPLSKKMNTRENQSIKLTSIFKLLKFLGLESSAYQLYRFCPHFIRRIIKSFSNARLSTVRKLSAAEKRYLIDVLRPEIMALADEFDFPLDKWQLHFDPLEEMDKRANFFDLSYPAEQFISSFLGERAARVPSKKQLVADNKLRNSRIQISPGRINH